MKQNCSIGSLAQALNVHHRTLRIYDKQGILTPTRKKGGRYYTLNDFDKAKFIQFLTKNLALNLVGVKIILAMVEKKNIGFKNSIDYVNELANAININDEIQKNNIAKTSKRGRKKLK